jgi:diacylglycerol kinase family enzyme
LQQIQDSLRDAGVKYSLIPVQNSSYCETAIRQAAKNDGLVIAAGGDGTVNAVANLCYRHQARMGVIPLGTFNYFAREIGAPSAPVEALQTALNGVETKVAIGLANDRVFLNNACTGLYATLIREREEANSVWGRTRIVGAISAFFSLLRNIRYRKITLTKDKQQEFYKTYLLFVGHNRVQLESLGLDIADCKAQGLLGAVIMKPAGRFEILRMIARSVTKNLHHERLIRFCHHDFTVTDTKKRIRLVIDGEIVKENSPVQFTFKPNALRVMILAPVNENNAEPVE